MIGLVSASTIALTAVIEPIAATAATPGAGSNFDCYGGTVYSVQRGARPTDASTIWALDSTALTSAGVPTVPAAAVTTIPGAGNTNAFGITRGGSKAYVIDQAATSSTTTVHIYTAATSTWTSAPGTSTNGDQYVAGAVDPSSGIYYYGTYVSGVATIYGFNTATNTAIPGIIATAALPVTTAGGANGDFAFDQGGNLYLVDSVGTAAGLGVVHGPLPTTGSANPPTLAETTLQNYNLAAGVSYNGIAFDNSGHLYVEYTSGTVTNLLGLDPNTGVALGTGAKQQGIGTLIAVDLSACSLNPTLTVQKNIVTRDGATDQFGLSITGGNITLGNTAETVGNSLGLQKTIDQQSFIEAGPVIGVSGTGYTIAETAASGSLVNYTTTYSCLDAAAGNRVVAAGTGQSFALNFPTPAAGATGPFVKCTFTNTSKPTITFTSALSGARANTGDQFNAGVYTGSAGGTLVSSAIKATTMGSGSSVTAGTGTTGAYQSTSGTAYYLTENAAGTTNLAQYTKLITCTDANRQQTGLPTDQPYTGTLSITPVPGAAISCVLTNAATLPTLVLVKALGGPRALSTDQFTVAIRTGSVTGAVVNSAANSTTTGTGSSITTGSGTTGTFTAATGTTYYLTETGPSNYTSAITCTDANGIQTGLPSGVSLGTGYALTPAAGAALACTLTNTGTPVNLSLTKTNPTQLTVGTPGNYTLTVTNNGGAAATTARVVDKLPANVQFNSAAGTDWSCAATGTVATGQMVTCNYTGSIASTATSNLTLNVTPQAGAAGTIVQNKAAVDPTGGTNPVDPSTCTATGTPTGCAVAAGQAIDKVTATPDTGTTAPGTPISSNVLANDTVSTGFSLVPSTVTVPTIAGHGSTTVNTTTGAITYTPAAGFSGVDTYGYRVCDNSTPTAVCANTTVSITVPQTVTAVDDTASTGQNTAVTTAVLSNDAHTANGAPLDPTSLTATQGTHGTVVVRNDGTITYTPTAGYTGPDAYTYTVCDTSTPTPVCGTATVNVTVGANVVTAVDDTANTTPGVAVTTDVRANDSSSTGQPLAVPTINTVPGHGTTAIDPTTGVITYTPATGFSGADAYTYQVCDTSSPTPVCSIATVTVNVPNQVTALNDAATTPQNTAVPVPVIANDTVRLNGALLNPASVAVSTAPAHGTATVNPITGTVLYTPSTGYTGPDSFSYQVCDRSTPTPLCAAATANITVGANTVTASKDTDTTAPGNPVTTDVRNNDSSSTGQPLANPSVTLAPGHGTTAVDPTTGNITYTPAVGFSGVDTYTYRVCDTSNPTPVCATATVTVTVPNVLTANDDTVTTPQNQPVTTPVLSNDTVSPNGSPLDATSLTATQGAHGAVVVKSDGTITYTPAGGYTGPDSYTYTVCDRSSPTPVCSTATVDLTVGANVVTANPDSTTTPPGIPVSTDVRTNDSSSTGQLLANPVVSTPADDGTTAVDPTTGQITYTPAVGFSGVDTYRYTVCDTSNPTPVCSVATVTISVPNVVTAKDDIVATPQNTPNGTPVLDNDTISNNGAPLNPASVTVATPPAHGATTINTGNGVITYTPSGGYTGPDSYTYTVCDESDPTPVCGSATVNITVGANTVSATPDSDTTRPNTAVTTNVRSNDSSSTGQPLADPIVTKQPAHGSAAVNSAGRIVYTPAAGFSGTDLYTYEVCDTSNPTPVCSTATVTITVPQAVLAVNDTGTTPPRTAITTDVLANDTHTTDGAPLNPTTVDIAGSPAEGTTSVNPTSGAITYTPNSGFSGVDSYLYTVCDKSTPTPVCSTATVTITVPSIVTAVDDTAATGQNTPVTTTVLTNDTTTAGAAPLDPTSVIVTDAPTHGTATATRAGAIVYEPDAGYSGRDSYQYQVCDISTPAPVCATATVNITVTPNQVTAVADTAATAPRTAVTVDVLTNDTARNDRVPLNPATVKVTGRGPAHGTTTSSPRTGRITYTPAAGFSGVDTFTYQVCDSSNPTPVCSAATVTITVRNTVAAVDDAVATPENTATLIPILINDTITSGGAPLDPTSVKVSTDPEHGKVTVKPDGTALYTPNHGYTGTDTFHYQVCDTATPKPNCAVATATVTIQKTGLSIVKKAFVVDTDHDGVVSVGDTIDYTFTTTNTGQTPVTGVSVIDPMIGSVSCPATSLAPGTSMLCHSDAGHVITTDDAKSGGVTNSASAIGAPSCPGLPSGLRRNPVAAVTAAGCPTVVQVRSATATVVTPISSGSVLSITKTGTWNDLNHDNAAEAGETISWVIQVSNPGRSTVTGFRVEDPTAGKVTCPSGALAPGTSMMCTVPDHLISSADVEAGHVDNVAFATGNGPGGPVVSPSVTATVALPAAVVMPVLPNTGVPATQITIGGLLTLLAGAALLLIGRRRRSA